MWIKKKSYTISDSEEEEEKITEPYEECHKVHRPEFLTWSGEKYEDKKAINVLVCTKNWKIKRMVFLSGKDGTILSSDMKKNYFYFAITFTKEGDHQTEKWRINIIKTQPKRRIVEMIGKLYPGSDNDSL